MIRLPNSVPAGAKASKRRQVERHTLELRDPDAVAQDQLGPMDHRPHQHRQFRVGIGAEPYRVMSGACGS